MKFKEYKYIRPNLDEIKERSESTASLIKNANNVDEVIKAVNDFNIFRGHVNTMRELCGIRNTINTVDEFYCQEQDWFDNNSPYIDEAFQLVNEALLTSKYRQELENEFGKQWFNLLECSVKVFSPEIIDELQLENQYVTEYQKLKASAKIEFDGKINNLAQMAKYCESEDREIRHQANEAIMSFYKDNEDHFDDILDRLVKVRDTISKKLGYDSFTEVAYLRMMRTDYNASDVEGYRKQVLNDLVGYVCELQNQKAHRLGLDQLYNYDMSINFKDGNAKVTKSKDELVNAALKMYSDMSDETKEFFEFMVEHELLDLETKPNKSLGGYCTFIYDYASPFIFSNFNGTSGDVDVLTHEAGHAFQVFRSLKTQTNIEYMFPTYEACEIHSMSMEFFAYPYMESFFGEDAKKYYNQHLSEAICFIPYGVTVDEFQHELYKHPEYSKAKRKEVYREIEKKYMPYKHYDNDFLERGGFFFKQGHIFESPFYYIDYTLAQVCALQFLNKNLQNHQKAWSDYKRLCDQGGSKSFFELLKVANLENPFTEGCINKTMEQVKLFLKKIEIK